MLLQSPAESPYDLRFNFLGFPVRIAWGFWIVSVILGFGLVQTIEDIFQADSPGRLPLLILWAICLLVSILIHELGHALAFRQNGIESSIVLYHFGGLAIPQSESGPNVRRNRGHTSDIWISFAGPLAQFMSAVVLMAGVHFAGYALEPDPRYSFFPNLPGISDGKAIDSPGLSAILIFYSVPSVYWAILNLIPVLPLDGGQIARSFVLMRGGDISQALWISVIAAGLTAAYGMSIGQNYLAIFFLIMGVTNFQALQRAGNSWR